MDEEKKEEKDSCCDHKKWHDDKSGLFGGFYFLGIIGAAVFYLQNASGFWEGFLGILQALVWPAFLVYEALVRLAA